MGVFLDLEFSVTQSFFHASHLINLIYVFNTGRVEFKSGSPGLQNSKTLTFKITNRISILEKVFPFWKTYILPVQTSSESERFRNFRSFEDLFSRGVHPEKEKFITEMLPLWDRLRKQKGQPNQSFESLQEAINYVNENALT